MTTRNNLLCLHVSELRFCVMFVNPSHAGARCYELMLERTFRRQTFGKFLHEHGSCREMIANSASDLEAARLLTLSCAEDIDRLGVHGARDKIALIKVTVPELTSRVVDRAVQVRVQSVNLHSCACLSLVWYIDLLFDVINQNLLNSQLELDLWWGRSVW